MTVASQVNKVIYTGSGTTGPFAFTFGVYAQTDLLVQKYTIATAITTDLVLTTDYTVNITGFTGGSVTLVASISNAYRLIITRVLPLTQAIDYVENDPFPAQTHEEGLDRGVMIDQQLQEQLDRALLIDAGSTQDPATILQSIYDAETNSAASAAASAASAAASAASASAASTSATNAATSATAATTNGALQVGYAQEWAKKAHASLISVAAGGNGTTDYSALHWSTASSEWAGRAHNSLIPVVDGGNGTTDYSARHWSVEAANAAASVLLPIIGGGDAGKVITVNPGATAYILSTPGVATVVDDFTIINDGGAIRVNDFVLDNIMLNAMRIQSNHSLTVDTLIDGVEDTFTDTTGIDSGPSVDEVFEGGSYKTPVLGFSTDDKLILNGNHLTGTFSIVDATETHVITQVGDAKLLSSYKYFGVSSLELHSALTQYLTTPDHADFSFGSTLDFSVDCWFKVDAYGSTQYIYGKRTGAASKEVALLIGSTGQIQFFTSDTTEIRVSTAQFLLDNDWHHIYVERRTTGTVLSVWLDGYQTGYATGTAKDITSSGTFQVGANGGASTFNGNIDEFRLSNITRFSAAPIAQPYIHFTLNDNAASTTVTDYGSAANNGASVGNTSTLHAGGKVKDALTFNGTTNQITLDGIAATIDSDTVGTVMAWVYADTTGADTWFSVGTAVDATATFRLYGGKFHFDVNNNPTALIGVPTVGSYGAGIWHHIAVVQDGVSLKIYINGVDDTGTVTGTASTWYSSMSATANNVTVGSYRSNGNGGGARWLGRIEDFRLYRTALTAAQVLAIRTAGVAGYYSLGSPSFAVLGSPHTSDANTKLLLHFNGGALLDLTDSAGSPKAITAVGGAGVSSPFGTGSLYVDGTGDYLTAPDSADWDFGSADFTVECWFRKKTTGVQNELLNHGNNAGAITGTNFDIRLDASGGVNGFWSSGSTQYNSGSGISVGNNTLWHHYALVRNGVNLISYADGLASATVNVSTNAGNNPTNTLLVGALQDVVISNFFDGYMAEVRISKGIARYTSAFTPSLTPYAIDSYDKFMIRGDVQDDSLSYHSPSFNSGAAISSSSPKFGTGSLAFDGTNDDVTIPNHSDWDIFSRMNAGWTVDFWVKHTTPANAGYYICHYADASNYWCIRHTSTNTTAELIVAGSTLLSMSPATSISDSTWHHIALIKIANDTDSSAIGLYLDATQIGYVAQTSVKVGNISGLLYLGQKGDGSGYLGGYMDGVRVHKNDLFTTVPTVGITDTFTLPVTEPTVSATTTGVMTLQTIGAAVVGAAPTNIRVYIDLEDIDPVVVLNTDITVKVSRDNGTTFTTAVMAQTGQATFGRRLIADTVDVSAQPDPGVNNSLVVVKVQTFNAVQMRLHAISQLWG